MKKNILFIGLLATGLNPWLISCKHSSGADAGSTVIPDVTAPTTTGSLSFSAVAARSVTITWSAATDDSTPAAQLQYKLVKDDTAIANINTIALVDAKSGSDLLQDWLPNITTKAVTSLAPIATTHYFAVLVRDAAGNKSLYTPASQAIPAPLWVQQAYLKASNAEANDRFGVSVSISGDSVVVGAQSEDSNQAMVSSGALPTLVTENDFASNAGAAYVFVRDGSGNWSQQAYLKAPNAETNDGFGYSVAISGDSVVVGAVGEASNQATVSNGALPTALGDDDSAAVAGAAYVFVRDGSGNWSQQAYLKAPNAEANDQFGYSVSISGDSVVVGALQEDSNQATVSNSVALPTALGDDDSVANAGAAYVFVRSGTTWAQQAYLKAPNPDANDNFGVSVAISGDSVVVGAFQEDSNQATVSNSVALPTALGDDDSVANAGAAYVFVRSGTTWAQQAYLKAPNPDANDNFGVSVSISGDSVVVGATGEASNQTTVSNSGALPTRLGDNDTIAAAGAAYVFVRSGTTWSQQAYLKAPNPEVLDALVYSVAISGDSVVVGASGEDSNQITVSNSALPTPIGDDDSASAAGAAYVFVRDGSGNWSQQAYLKAPNAETNDQFGSSVSISGDSVVVGAVGEASNQTTVSNSLALPTPLSDNDSALNTGAAYIFVRP